MSPLLLKMTYTMCIEMQQARIQWNS
jgi:hypothetical protein